MCYTFLMKAEIAGTLVEWDETKNQRNKYGSPVRVIRTLTPVAVFSSPNGERIYDFGQNFSGAISAQIHGRQGQKIVFRHAEVMANDELFVKPLRTAKARVEYICREGDQHYSPTHPQNGRHFLPPCSCPQAYPRCTLSMRESE